MNEPYIPSTEEVRAAASRGIGGDWFDRWLARYRESVIDEVEDHLVRRDQFTERTLDVIDELREKK